MKTNTFMSSMFLATVMMVSCDSAQFSGGNKVVEYDRTEIPDGGDASVKPSKSSEESSKNDGYQFSFKLAESEAVQSFNLGETVSNQKNLTLHASYLDVERSINVVPQDSYYTAINYDGRIFKQKRRFFDKKFIDIILVVDNSSSMQIPQQRLAAALPSLKTALQGMNWRIILTSTDINDACALKVFDENSSDVELSNSVLLGSNGSDQEVPLYRAYNILAGKCAAASIRPEAAPALMLLTNEDECSTGTIGNCPSVAGKVAGFPTAGGFSLADHLNALAKMSSFDMPAGVIAWLPSDAACSLGVTKASTITNQFASSWLTGSRVLGSICAESYSATLTTFATNIKNMPDPFQVNASLLVGFAKGNQLQSDSQKVEFTDGTVLRAPDVKFENSIVSFASLPQYFDKAAYISAVQQDTPKTNIVKWSTDAKGGCDQTMTYTGVIGTRDMNTSKVYNSATSVGFPNFKMSTTACEITFDAPLSYPYQLYVYTTPKAASQVKFSLGENAVPSSAIVKLDNVVLTGGYTIDANNVLTLTNPITSGKVVVSYKSLNDPTIRYDFSIPADATELSVVDAAGVTLNVQRDGSAIVIDRSDIIEGRVLDIRYKTKSKSSGKALLSNKPSNLDALYKLISDQCAVDISAAQLLYDQAEMSINLTGCLNSSGSSKLELRYKYLMSVAEFKLPIATEVLKNIGKVYVAINGKEFPDYSLNSNILTLPNPSESGDVLVQVNVK